MGVKIRAGDPLVGVAGGMAAGWRNYMAALTPPVHTFLSLGLDVAESSGSQVEMPATSTGARDRLRQQQALQPGGRSVPVLEARAAGRP